MRPLVDFSFAHETTDATFGIFTADNERSLRALEKCGFNGHALTQEEDGALVHDLIVRRQYEL